MFAHNVTDVRSRSENVALIVHCLINLLTKTSQLVLQQPGYAVVFVN